MPQVQRPWRLGLARVLVVGGSHLTDGVVCMPVSPLRAKTPRWA